MAISTIYDVRVRLLMTDKGSKHLLSTLRKLRNIKVEMQGIRSASAGIGAGMGRLAGAAVGGFGIYKAKEALIDFNANLEQSRITMAGMMSQATGQAFGNSIKEATSLVDRLQIRARASVGTTEDMVQMASMITRPISAAGLGMKDLEDFTVNAVVASKAFGIQADMAARDIEAALMGQLSSRDRFARGILEAKSFGGKYIGEEGRRAFNSMSGEDRAKEFRKGLLSPGISAMAKAQEHSFAGVTSTLKDTMQMTAGKIGLPLFQAITKEIQSWQKWIDSNGPAIAEFSQSLSQGLVEGFKMAKDAAAFLVKHKDLLLALAKAWLAGKAVKGLVGGFVDIGKMMQSVVGSTSTGLSGLAAKANVAANALGLIAGAAVMIADLVDKAQEEGIDKDVKAASFGNLVNETIDGKRSRKFLYEEAKRLGYLDKEGRLGGKSPLSAIGTGKDGVNWVTGQSEDTTTFATAKTINDLLKSGAAESGAVMAQKFAADMSLIFDAFSGEKRAGTLDLLGKMFTLPATGGGTKSDRDINVNIRNVEVATDDADRFVMEMANLAEDAIKSPSTARGSIRY